MPLFIFHESFSLSIEKNTSYVKLQLLEVSAVEAKNFNFYKPYLQWDLLLFFFVCVRIIIKKKEGEIL